MQFEIDKLPSLWIKYSRSISQRGTRALKLRMYQRGVELEIFQLLDDDTLVSLIVYLIILIS